MSKSKKNIQVQLETEKLNGDVYDVLKVGNESIGKIREIENNKYEVTSSNNDVFRVKNADEGIEVLLSEYHLHKN
ncbi:DUF2969 family protein [Apilactobacillus xinyiensis]|uniref:DUF2969 domain-containing protein n=1 Tax=Apilactobacillus xinyiensis TaxID=2841032 RepID=A0ABT0HZI0_9LACO|nr:DUF2969 family protein [Apilactobacillus xinyiensis]MCK8623986.1 DUF2969 domain-containing protein [Apilactobacillus xinyiensis]MCL0311579.1 DUF2969 domain-containing protein [Apilactobacillus xinyiensis]MCL0318277.1 DUF2969 domain-containing protein [Apilactobacillus xinyiensis]MCL0330045.1 DUF2969 domain-containing protein [Apilactobacillus xinyiensis]